MCDEVESSSTDLVCDSRTGEQRTGDVVHELYAGLVRTADKQRWWGGELHEFRS